ncbi:hypothetical protein J4212_03130 [Candidatus Woesearchaeota archaeon]|nr:hypothetical protein [Candidatus Woesearchaeota archaeon]
MNQKISIAALLLIAVTLAVGTRLIFTMEVPVYSDDGSKITGFAVQSFEVYEDINETQELQDLSRIPNPFRK